LLPGIRRRFVHPDRGRRPPTCSRGELASSFPFRTYLPLRTCLLRHDSLCFSLCDWSSI
jgi:hypothetical protein